MFIAFVCMLTMPAYGPWPLLSLLFVRRFSCDEYFGGESKKTAKINSKKNVEILASVWFTIADKKSFSQEVIKFSFFIGCPHPWGN